MTTATGNPTVTVGMAALIIVEGQGLYLLSGPDRYRVPVAFLVNIDRMTVGTINPLLGDTGCIMTAHAGGRCRIIAAGIQFSCPQVGPFRLVGDMTDTANP